MKGIYWLALFGITSVQGFFINPSLAQSNIIPDNSLGAESSQVIENFQGLPVEVIWGGAERGINLFHSFREFNVSEGRGAYFSSPNPEIQNILARVTGNNRSDILGTLGTFGSSQANLFLINPNGIVFGSNASLDVGGSFVATTADGIAFGEQGLFSATEPEGSNLLSVNPSALFFNAVNSQGQIVNRSRATSTVLETPVNGLSVNGLSVVTGKSLLLVGNDVPLEGGILQAPSGRVEIGGLAETGTVGLNVDENNLQLSYPVNVARANVVLDNGAAINVNGDRAGNIRLEGNRVSLSGASSIDSRTVNQDSGEIVIRAEKLELAGNSRVASTTSGTGKTGDITIDTGSFTAQENSFIFTSSILASGRTGNISLKAKDSVNIFNRAGISNEMGIGDEKEIKIGGNISIETKYLNLQNSTILVSTFSEQKNAVLIIIKATNSVNLNNSLMAVNAVDLNNSMSTSSFGAGTGGSIFIETKKLNIENGSAILKNGFNPFLLPLISTTNSENVGKANSGDLTIIASESVKITGESVNGIRSALYTINLGGGDAGNLTIDTGRLVVKDGGVVSVQTLSNSQGKGGKLTVIARDSVEISGTSTNEQVSSGLLASTGGTGDGGEIKVTTDKLIVRDGARISATTNNQGKGGSLTITAPNSVEISGTSTNEKSISGLFAFTGGTGDAGEIQVTTDKLIVRDGAVILASTNNQGKGGSLTITASDFVEISGSSANSLFVSGLVTDTFGAGDAGNLTIDTGRLVVKDGGFVSVATFSNSQGKGGKLTVIARDSVEISGTSTNEQVSSSLLAATLGTGDGGEIQVTTDKLIVRDGAEISATTNNQGKGGSLTITASDFVEISGSSANSLFVTGLGTDTFGAGDAGNLTIDTGRLVIKDGGVVSVGTGLNSEGKGGNLTVIARDSVEISGTTTNEQFISALFAATNGTGDGGAIQVTTDKLIVRDGAAISATTNNQGKGGSLTVTASDFVEISGSSGLATATLGAGDAGNLTIDTGRLVIKDGGVVSVGTLPNSQGKGGNLTVIARDSVEISGTTTNEQSISSLFAATLGTGDGGTINLRANSLSVNNNARISAQSEGTGKAGDITINTNQGFHANNGQVITTAQQAGGGKITITSKNIHLFGDSDIRTNVFTGDGGGGNIKLTANSIIAFDDSDILAFARDGKGGDINLKTPAFFGENYQPAPKGTDPATLDGNNRVDINASGAVSGVITLPDTTFIQNSLTELQQNPIDTNALILTSCIARSNKVEGTFVITGSGGLPNRPGDPYVSPYPTGTVQGVTPHTSSWKKGDPIMEPTGVYPLEDGQLVMSREC
ncbi:filamentous hemagglutinin N-terminal domain-containing protein [Moorena sp. SIO4G3]|uniref:two-partner secretion domain-containing protein n=1 Tax=Moorena sp. SIO4G3 TaxID=2607821 RepID=UPI00142AAE7A|nr:filamentous hemagglutinin N-terminal domain-containing protein [Moorena sp. SIO4G3]NEO77986.1 filamentous hemagglutinin N-terminal domain-containing protein [Moorena sp. SIO4G3]